MLKMLHRCLQHHLPIDLIYMTSEQLITHRTVTLYVITEHEVKGYCHLRNSLRTFKLDGILAAYPTSVQSK
ncbi:WYL domain-containing protein [Guptibacillus algicola]|uniref:WYL domain-containing protein n=1 Tax=Guptibacillus algicola TaxID=225844 RepID=UPI001CD73B48|nr:WYL domain-containing protein [Alkalihalobacillus algicola]MCA0986134.1 WYL domain-containing protein [Alkalihalobacillus algicola]